MPVHHRCRSLAQPGPAELASYAELGRIAWTNHWVNNEVGEVANDNILPPFVCTFLCVRVHVQVHGSQRWILGGVSQESSTLFFRTVSPVESLHYWGAHAAIPGFLGGFWWSNLDLHDWKTSIYLPIYLLVSTVDYLKAITTHDKI